MMSFNRLVRHTLALAALTSWLIGCGGGSGSTNPSTPTSGNHNISSNVIPVVVNGGPNLDQINTLYTSVTICPPGVSGICQTIDHVVVDTGSTGLRLLSSVLAPGLNLPTAVGAGGHPLLNCQQFMDTSFVWGSVAMADVSLGSNTATNVPIQIIGDARFNALSRNCASGNANNTVDSLGAKGILGVGQFKEDCGPSCTNIAQNGYYFTCTTAACTHVTGAAVERSKQVQNPIARLASDNNGLVIDLPNAPSGGALSLSGNLILGVGTQSNNQLDNTSVLRTDAAGFITTLFEGRILKASFLDTGSNGLFFDSTYVPRCTTYRLSSFYCPPTAQSIAATLVGSNGTKSNVSATLNSAATMLTNSAYAVFPQLAGSMNDAQSFDWGLPFFFGRRVFIALEDQAPGTQPGPFFAF